MRTDVGPSPLLFRKLSKTAMVGGSTKSILDEVSGEVLGGDMMAVLGASGSGKTTLLDVLAGRKNTGIVEGTVHFAGQEINKGDVRHLTGYVEQFDTLVGELTVEQMLMCTQCSASKAHHSWCCVFLRSL